MRRLPPLPSLPLTLAASHSMTSFPIGFALHHQEIWSHIIAGESDLLQTWPGTLQLLVEHAEFQICGHSVPLLEVDVRVINI